MFIQTEWKSTCTPKHVSTTKTAYKVLNKVDACYVHYLGNVLMPTLISSGTVHDPRTHCCEYTGATMALLLHIGRHYQCRTHGHYDTVYMASVHLTDSAQI